MNFAEVDFWEVLRKIDIQIYWRLPIYAFISLIKRHRMITFLFEKSSSPEIFGTLFLLIFFDRLIIFGVVIFWNSTWWLLLTSEIIKQLSWSLWGSASNLIRQKLTWDINILISNLHSVWELFSKQNHVIQKPIN